MRYSILVVEDEASDRLWLRTLLEGQGYLVQTCNSGAEAIQVVKTAEKPFTVVLLDYKMRSMTGAETARAIQALNTGAILLIYSGDPSREALRQSIGSGAVAFLDKSPEPEPLFEKLRQLCRHWEKARVAVAGSVTFCENAKLIKSIGMVGRSNELANVARKVHLYRKNRENILIVGNRGTGKELVAKALHLGPSLHAPQARFLAANCAVWQNNTDLMRRALFGVKKGSYTGAHRDEPGILRSAGTGTVFLDEFHTLTRPAQQILLRALQERRVRPVESDQSYPFHCRVVAGAQEEIHRKVETREFQADLFDRIHVGYLHLPPLSVRKEDIEPLIHHFCEKYARRNGNRKQFLKRTIQCLEQYSWPGNVRELENTVTRLCMESRHNPVRETDLEPKFQTSTQSDSFKTLDEVIEAHVAHAFQEHTSQSKTARALAIPRSSLRRLLIKHGLLSEKKKG